MYGNFSKILLLKGCCLCLLIAKDDVLPLFTARSWISHCDFDFALWFSAFFIRVNFGDIGFFLSLLVFEPIFNEFCEFVLFILVFNLVPKIRDNIVK